MKASEFLTEAKTYIEKGWTQRTYARDASGHIAEYQSDKACSWCALGAMRRVEYEDSKILYAEGTSFNKAVGYMIKVVKGIDYMQVAFWNDTPGRSQAAILAGFDEAIALAKEDEGQ